MNDVLHHDDPSLARPDRELTLSTGTILGIFFGLILLCGACFGAGYFMGHKSQPAALALNDPAPDAIAGSSTAKPAAGSPYNASADVTGSGGSAPSVTVAPAPVVKPTPRHVQPAVVPAAGDTATVTAPASTKVADAKVAAPKAVAPSALLPSAAPAAAGNSFIMVQVAAVSHQEDADLLMGALRSRGYSVMARKGSGDPLIHVQVGPFSNKATAEAMRQKLMGDGYNAMLKY